MNKSAGKPRENERKMMMKKAAAVLLAVLLLAGCGTAQVTGEKVQPAQNGATEKQETDAAATSEPTATPEVSLEEWLQEMPEPRAGYRIEQMDLPC